MNVSLCLLTLLFSNFIIAITFPRLLGAFKPQGAFGWYAGWNIIGFFLVLLYVPETKALSLEELDQGPFSMLSVSSRIGTHVSYAVLHSVLCSYAHPLFISAQGPSTKH